MKLKRSQLKKVKLALRDFKKSDELSEDSEQEDKESKTIYDVKKALKEMESEDEEEKKPSLKELKRDAKREYRRDKNETKPVQIRWNFEEGDFVSFEYNGKEEVGLVIKTSQAEGHTSSWNAKNHSSVVVMSSAGRMLVNPKKNKMTKVED